MNPAIVLAVGGIIRRGDDLLLIQRARDPGAGRWSLPGGRVEPGEGLRAALQRELLEEVGLHADIGRLVGVAERAGPGFNFIVADYEATVAADAVPVAGDDASAVAWVPTHGLGEWDLVDWLGEFLAEHGIT